MGKWIDKAKGEISNLRNRFAKYGWNLVGGSHTSTYKLDSSRVDYELARQLYHNTNENYKLGSGFAKLVINTTVGFMGVPDVTIDDEKAKEQLDKFFKENMSRLQRTLRNSMREGDSFVWITREDTEDNKLYPDSGKKLMYNIIPPEQIKKINRDPVTGLAVEYILESMHDWEDVNGNTKQTKITQHISADEKTVICEGDVPPGIEEGTFTNHWGFIPIVHFKNESDTNEAYGRSDLESIEPFIKAYHDVMVHAIQGSKQHSTPRLKMKLKDVESFLRNNFGVDDPTKFAKEGKSIDLEGHDVLFLGEEEDAEFIEVTSATGDANILLKMLFYCIVDASGTPEFIFGVHTPSSQASVKEQMPILIRQIERKREQFDEPFKLLCRIILAMTAESENEAFSTYAAEMEWETIDPRDGKEVADEIKVIVDALNTAVGGNLMSTDAAVDFLKEYISTMEAFEGDDDTQGEKDRIMKSRLMQMGLEDSQFNDEQMKEINKILGTNNGGGN